MVTLFNTFSRKRELEFKHARRTIIAQASRVRLPEVIDFANFLFSEQQNLEPSAQKRHV